MHYNDTSHSPEPRLRDRLRDDFNQTGFFGRIRSEFEDIRDFYIAEEKKTRLDSMPWYKKWFILAFWLLKSMLLKLTPARRLLVIAATVMVMSNDVIFRTDNSVIVVDWHVPGLAIFIFILMLELKDRILARSELAEGRGVQRALMPEEFPSFPGWTLSLHSEPANEVGGDLVDFILLEEKSSAVILGDVSGKGLRAAIMMAKLQTTIRVLLFDETKSPLPIHTLNKIFKRETVPGMFASLLFVKLESDTNTFSYVNAGHLPPLVISKTGVRELPKGTIALGIMDEPQFDEQQITLAPGETFIAFSDGVVEAQNVMKDQFGLDRLKKFLPTIAALPVSEIGNKILREVAYFVGEARPHDDLSFIILRKS